MYLSMRASDAEMDMGRLIQLVIVEQGRAGGHGMMAGGRIPLAGMAPDELAIEIEHRFIRVMNQRPELAEPLL